MFEKLEKLTYSELIIEKMKELLIDRSLGAGDRLPSERELAEEFGVSRASIREAIKALAALGLLEARTGAGTYVRADLAESVLEPLSWAVLLAEGVGSDLAEMRQIIEPDVAALAAERATVSDKKELLKTIDAMKRAMGDPPAVAKADLQFHLVLAQSARNQVLLEVMHGLQRLLQGLITSRLLHAEGQTLCLQHHAQIYRAIEEGDAAKAREAMLRSLHKDPLFELGQAVDAPSPAQDNKG